jgi:biotin transport system substrate-specific component
MTDRAPSTDLSTMTLLSLITAQFDGSPDAHSSPGQGPHGPWRRTRPIDGWRTSWPHLSLDRAIPAAAVLFITALTAAAAQVSVPLPFTPVPFTLQPMVVLIGGAVLGARLGMLSQVLYLAAGIAGLPVFAASPVLPQGVFRLLGPTGGYLMAYPLAAWITGALAERGLDRRYITSVLAMAAGLGVVFAGGVFWLAFWHDPLKPAVGLETALSIGAWPFVPADLIKVLLAGGALPALWRFFGPPPSPHFPKTKRN